ncbi:hypothetical protein [Thermomonas sp.]|uniref:hypothetical protein n=1 Tax=Thermomonas sp. TaxID=1971895 RepID=UPI0024889EEC|nr:hypothetical protein [Thermomonas sp.]MDI1252547.1 hypothetical protein [Thermomonas sp.]
MSRSILLCLGLCAGLLATANANASDPKPEIQRQVGTPQSVGVAHTLRTIPEACARLEGRFTGDKAKPYAFAAVPTSARCQPRARLVDAVGAKASVANGWLLNDVIRVPSANCPSQQAVVRIWRQASKAAAPKLDAQGRARIYLKDGLEAARQGQLPAMPMFAAAMTLEGLACK